MRKESFSAKDVILTDRKAVLFSINEKVCEQFNKRLTNFLESDERLLKSP